MECAVFADNNVDDFQLRACTLVRSVSGERVFIV
jgi:hypothetical protein